MEKQISYKSQSILVLLGVAFVVLKLIGVINWSWWWVTLPFWGPVVCALILLLVVGIIVVLNTK